MPLQTHNDGCIAASIPTRPFRAVFRPDCPHTKLLNAVIDFRSVDLDNAEAYARTFQLPRMTLDRVGELVTSPGVTT